MNNQFRFLNHKPGPRRNKRKERLKRTADNPLTKYTGHPVHKLTGKGASDCHLCFVKNYHFIPMKKIAYAVHNGWQRFEMGRTAKRMRFLRVRQSCGVNECVNPNHLIGTEKAPPIF